MVKILAGLAERAEVLKPGQTIEAELNLSRCPDIPRLSKDAYLSYARRFYAPHINRLRSVTSNNNIPLHFVDETSGYAGVRVTKEQLATLSQQQFIEDIGINFFYN